MRINSTPEEFADIIILYLFDQMMKGDYTIKNNKRFAEMINIFQKRAFKPIFLRYFLKCPMRTRSRYKMIKNVFNIPGFYGMSGINVIQPSLISKNVNKNNALSKTKIPTKDPLLKKILRTSVKMIVGKQEIDEKQLDKLYEMVLNKMNEENIFLSEVNENESRLIRE